MWKYNCKRQLLILFGAFLIGFLTTYFFSSSELFWSMAKDMLPADVLKSVMEQPLLISLAGGIGLMGMANVITVANVVSAYYSGSIFIVLMFLMFMPDWVVLIGILSLPLTIIVWIYGWATLNRSTSKALRQADITGDDEIVRIYTIHHPLDESYKALGENVRRTMRTIRFAFVLGLVAIGCSLVFIDNFWILILLLTVCMVAMQFLSRVRMQAFNSIAMLLYQECNPEACMSALLYYSKRGSHYKLANRALMASCLIYLDEPELAQDVLIAYRRPNFSDQLQYYLLMGSIYYQLKDESGVQRCIDAVEKMRFPRGQMGMMMKDSQLSMLENKLNLMHGDFNESKKYFLMSLKASTSRLQSAECAYYIALISFVQQDYVLAKMYFEKTISQGGSLYYVENAQNYLAKIQQSHLLDEPDEYSPSQENEA